jgi:hypothetical protein
MLLCRYRSRRHDDRGWWRRLLVLRVAARAERRSALCDFEDMIIGGNLTITGWQSCWLGVARDAVTQNVDFNDNLTGDPRRQRDCYRFHPWQPELCWEQPEPTNRRLRG